MRRLILALAAALSAAGPAAAWTRPAHMVAAAIAWDELKADDAATLAWAVRLLQAHPDRGPFEVAIGRTTGEARAQRIFLEAARWPDDVRGGPFDHPTWHYRMRPVVDESLPGPRPPADSHVGEAREAVALQAALAADPRAPQADRALAIAWLLHIVPDLHQPLHAAQRFSRETPQGDQGGSRAFVRDVETGEAISLHWHWDDAVHRDGDPAPVIARAAALRQAYPRSRFPELAAGARVDAVDVWTSEGYALAAELAYRPDLRVGPDAGGAAQLPEAYARDSRAAAERRLTLAGYRLAAVLSELRRRAGD